ncbi:glutamate decarboxylase [Trichinella spiralis]|uniref:glutamate decarboxylase n=1 Tax=Trichinella spiralis TaxID=6334 RepID=UPI0001EFCC27|nr:glutamate decarboxylase [Trichinella spiralis]
MQQLALKSIICFRIFTKSSPHAIDQRVKQSIRLYSLFLWLKALIDIELGNANQK